MKYSRYIIALALLGISSTANADVILHQLDYSNSGMTFNRSGLNVSKIAETYTPTSTHTASTLSFELSKNVTGTGYVYLNVYKDGTAPATASSFVNSSTILVDNVSTTPSFVDFEFNTLVLEADTKYWFILSGTSADNPILINTALNSGNADWARCVGCGGVYGETDSWGDPTGGPGSIKIYGSYNPISIVYPLASSTVNPFPAFKVDYGWLNPTNNFLAGQVIWSVSSTMVENYTQETPFNPDLNRTTWVGTKEAFLNEYYYKFYATTGETFATSTTYYAKIYLYSSNTSYLDHLILDSELYSYSDLISFSIGPSEVVEGEIPTIFSGKPEYSCDDKELTVWNPNDWGCVISNTVESLKIMATTLAQGTLVSMYNTLSGIFPISVVTEFNSIVQEISTSETSTDIIFTGSETGGRKIFGGVGRSFVILSSSTGSASILANTGFNMRNFLTNAIYAITGFIILIITLLVVKSFRHKKDIPQ